MRFLLPMILETFLPYEIKAIQGLIIIMPLYQYFFCNEM
jgi:hypothetical protein